MSITIVELFILFAAVVGSSALVTILSWLWHRSRQLDRPGIAMEELHSLREDLESTQKTTRELADRLEFMERLLQAGEEEPDDRRDS